MDLRNGRLKVIFGWDLRSKDELHCNCSMMPTFWLQAGTMLAASAIQDCSARLCCVNSSSLEGCYLEKQDTGRLSSPSGNT